MFASGPRPSTEVTRKLATLERSRYAGSCRKRYVSDSRERGIFGAFPEGAYHILDHGAQHIEEAPDLIGEQISALLVHTLASSGMVEMNHVIRTLDRSLEKAGNSSGRI